MSRTRNQRRRDASLRRLLTVALVVVLLAAVAMAVYLWAGIEAARESGAWGLVSTGQDYMPEEFDERAYRAALQRYNVEQGLILPLS